MKFRNLLLALVSLATLSACDAMHEDEDTTNCGLFVTFKYDYNLQRADMFKDHVGGVTLYVFDSDGRFVRSYEQNNISLMGRMLLGDYVHCMQIMDLPDGNYRFVALANQRPYAETLTGSGAKYRRAELTAGANISDLTVTLDRQATRAELPAQPKYVSNAAPLDTLWHGIIDTPVTVDNLKPTVTTVSLVRDTKMLTIALHNLDADKRANISADEFEFFIVDNNGRLAYNNDLMADDDLVYTPFSTWDSQVTDAKGTVTEATAHACLTFNRLVWNEDPDKNALLIIRNKQTQQEVAAINLTDALATGRNAYDIYAYSRQEYLDRAYDYYMDFFIKNGVWQYADVRINVLTWAHRIQNVDL